VIRRLRTLLKILEASGHNPKEISLADTVGMGNPEDVRELLRHVRDLKGSFRLSLHLHDTRGLGIANAYAGLLEGVDCFESSLGGLGGCPFTPGAAGNICTGEFVFLCHELGIETGVSLEALAEAARFLERDLGLPLVGKWHKSLKL
jgi:hydroxymethylglutaryl-CoA lyase